MLVSRFREELAARRLTVKEFALKAGLNYSACLKFHKDGHQRLDPQLVEAICRYLQLDLAQLMHFDPPVWGARPRQSDRHLAAQLAQRPFELVELQPFCLHPAGWATYLPARGFHSLEDIVGVEASELAEICQIPVAQAILAQRQATERLERRRLLGALR